MEFNEKLQQLRKQKGLTQEELAQALFVSRTAISKWESGRGYPSIDSLKEISKFFGVTIDRLLSGEELIIAVETDNYEKKKLLCNQIFSFLDISVLLFLIIPFFRQQAGDTVQAVSALSITEISLYMKIRYFTVIILLAFWGAITFIAYKSGNAFFHKYGNRISYILNIIAVFIFIVGMQPYPAVFMFLFLRIKAIMLMKKQ
ncbi:MAG: helix-turn-helix transcriptional regulator [Oscillospiraceae bacterium]|nr:helix-turn-helix transcriptional regulator [Oscillospiraceae bacterium]